jgi:CheY-like chemotaxis protein
MKGEPIVILLVEDDVAHVEIVRRNFEGYRLANTLLHVPDGQAALDYLYRQNEYSDPVKSPRPGIILLDLRLPKVDGMEVLTRIKSDPKLSAIPVVILTTSKAESDMVKAYAAHANSYLVKPVDFTQFIELMKTFGYYWLAWNTLPKTPED